MCAPQAVAGLGPPPAEARLSTKERSHGPREAHAAAFVPQFRGDYGKLRFHTEDLFVDAAAGKALIRWRCTLETKRGPAAWRGLDLLHVEHGRITEKLTYAKAKAPLLGERS